MIVPIVVIWSMTLVETTDTIGGVIVALYLVINRTTVVG